MQIFGKGKFPQILVLGLMLVALLAVALVAVACGDAAPAASAPPTAAQATTAPEAMAQPESMAQPTEALEAMAQPTAVPEALSEPAEAMVKVHPGRLSIMVEDLANERFDRAFGAGTGYHYGRIMGGYLISDNERKEMVPGIASEWSLSPDGLNWTFTIRKGVKFHDGSDLTAEDALWTIQHLFGPQAVEYVGQSSLRRIAKVTETIELSGPDTVSITTQKVALDIGDMMSETGGNWYHIMPKRATIHDLEEELAYDKNPIAAGPMWLTDHVPAAKMSFERFDDFYYQPKYGLPEDRRVNFKSLDLFLVPEEATRVAAIRAGEADIAPASKAQQRQVEAGGGRIVFSPEGVYKYIRLFGCYLPQYPCYDKRVRQALDYAFDKELMRDQLYGGPEVYATKGWSVVTPSTWGYTPALDPRPFDPDKARQLLADAGYPGGEGFGKLLVHTNPSIAMPFMIEAAQLAVASWIKELGIDAEVRVGDDSALKKLEITGGLNGQIWWRDNETRIDPINILGRYGDPENPSRLSEDPELARLVQEAVRTPDPVQRANAYEKLFPILREETYEFGFGYVNIPWAVSSRVLTWEPYPMSPWPSALSTITLK